jgi:hypothetical protein
MSLSHSIGVRPWRRVISRNSTRLCAACTVSGTSSSSAAAALAVSSSWVQVSTWAGLRKPVIRPLARPCTDLTSSVARSRPRQPASSSHS